MVEECNQCSCIPYENICCCPPELGITVTQPGCQKLPDDSIVGNPCFQNGISYWTYKFHVDCNPETRGISSIGIPICENIHDNIITVEENIDGCGTFNTVQFERISNDPNFGPAPAGFTWLKITVDDRYDKGVCVVYRISILGNFPADSQPIVIKAGQNIFEFSCDDCFLVPECPPRPDILVQKTCKEIIENNNITLNYTVDVTNPGATVLENVQFTDQIIYDATNITFGNIEVIPALTTDLSTPGIINISGNLGSINPGDIKTIIINIPINSIANPGKYLILETATASTIEVQSSTSCTLNIDAVRLRGNKCCSPGEQPNDFIFNLQVSNVGNSPETSINLIDTIVIPPGVIIQFTSFDGCSAVFADTQETVPFNTDITDKIIIIRCNDLIIPQNGIINKNIKIRIISTTAFLEPVAIINTINRLEFLQSGEQILLGIDNVPVNATVNVSGSFECQNPCQ